MWYALIAILTIFFVKTAIDEARLPAKYASKNSIEFLQLGKQNTTIRNRSSPPAISDKRGHPRYMRILDLPKNDQTNAPQFSATTQSDEKIDFDSSRKEAVVGRITANTSEVELSVDTTKTQTAKKDTQSKIPSIHRAPETIAGQSPIEAMPIIFKVIAICESGLKHHNKDGTIVEGVKHPADKGILQINFAAHEKKIRQFEAQFGLSVRTAEGNIKFGEWLYRKEGLRPWNASRSCWEPILRNLGYQNLR